MKEDFLDLFFPRVFSDELGGSPTPRAILETYRVHPSSLQAELVDNGFVSVEDRGSLLWSLIVDALKLSLMTEEPQALLEQRPRMAANSHPEGIRIEYCYIMAALCDSPLKEGGILRRVGLTKVGVMEIIQNYKSVSEDDLD